MNAPYQRISVPTSESWNSASQRAPRSEKANAPQAATTKSVAPLIQPPDSLITKAPFAPSMTAIQMSPTKGYSRLLKPWFLSGIVAVLLAAAASVLAAQEQVTVQTPAATEHQKQSAPFNSTEQIVTSPNTHNTQSNAHTSTNGTGAIRVAATPKVASPEKMTAKQLLLGEPEGKAEPTPSNNLVLVVPAEPPEPSATRDQRQLDAIVLPTSPQQAAKPQDSVQNTKGEPPSPTATPPHAATESTQVLDARSLALLALGVAGAGTVASLGLAFSARRATPIVEKFNFKDLTPTQKKPSPSRPAMEPAAKSAPIPQRAADLAYIDQRDWAAALERTYGVNTRPGPHNALVSMVGSRNANEDYGCTFELTATQAGSKLQCIFVADGCGGHDAGREASCLAIRAASEAVLKDFKAPPAQRVQTAFSAASAALIHAGRQFDENSLRTTLIVVLADESNYYCGWIGDGGIDLHRANGQWETLLIPHKSGAQNLLAASLGPDQVGEPSYATHARWPGDRIYIGSDGVFDVYNDPSAFWEWFETASLTKSPQNCLTELLAKCADHASFDDNMTVAYLNTPALRVAPESAQPTSGVQRVAQRAYGRGTQPA